jgi:hypothetical protein
MISRFLRWVADLDHAYDLAALDDRTLADMGVERGDIGRRVREAPEAPRVPEAGPRRGGPPPDPLGVAGPAQLAALRP